MTTTHLRPVAPRADTTAEFDAIVAADRRHSQSAAVTARRRARRVQGAYRILWSAFGILAGVAFLALAIFRTSHDLLAADIAFLSSGAALTAVAAAVAIAAVDLHVEKKTQR
ncbi:hypothetical protein ACPPVW_18475 [Leifsonia sp. McL0607]|uniref:hypothetical protein n=1 Tax=Leifsonia sp. McL0607 TaxID=3415672 RepID=UPI003CEF7571